MRRVSIRFAKDSWSYRKTAASVAPVKIAVSLPGGRREVWIKPHRRFRLYWWRVLRKEAELASTLVLKRRRDRWYAVFVFDVMPKREPPAEVTAFDVNENWVAVAKVSLLATVDRVATWNRQYINPTVYSIKTDFGRLARRYEAVRNGSGNIHMLGETTRKKCKMSQTRGSLENSRRDSAKGGVRKAG
jgi:hypothetical protein